MRYALTVLALTFSLAAYAEPVPTVPDVVATVATRTDTAMRMTVPVTITSKNVPRSQATGRERRPLDITAVSRRELARCSL